MPPQDYKPNSEANNIAMTIKVDGVSYRFELGEISAKIELELYNQSGGLRLSKVMQELLDGPTGFHLAAMVFLARRSRGDQVTFDEIADSIGLASDIDVELDGDSNDSGDLPEALAAN